MIYRQGAGHHVSNSDGTIFDNRALLALAHGQNAALRRVDDGRELTNAKHAQVRNRDRQSDDGV